MPTTTPFQSALSDKRRDRDVLRRRLELLDAEIAGFEAAGDLLGGHDVLERSEHVMFTSPNSAAQPSGKPVPNVRRVWRGILGTTASSYPTSFSADDLERVCTKIGAKISRNTIRSQTSTYTHQGVLERVGQGRFRLTPLGAQAIGLTITLESIRTAVPNLRNTMPAGDGDADGGQRQAEVEAPRFPGPHHNLEPEA